MKEITLKQRNITIETLNILGLKPNCLDCIHSEPEELMHISCKNAKGKCVSYEDNLFTDTCEHFETDFDTFFKGQKENIKVNYRGRSYTYIKDEK